MTDIPEMREEVVLGNIQEANRSDLFTL